LKTCLVLFVFDSTAVPYPLGVFHNLSQRDGQDGYVIQRDPKQYIHTRGHARGVVDQTTGLVLIRTLGAVFTYNYFIIPLETFYFDFTSGKVESVMGSSRFLPEFTVRLRDLLIES
jgi:hypothetical protein